ncbi:hypothetical protein [Ramlibacter sp.]|uniref:hypothetical protein n=1 Tax=Ramlibacter sp. TaxID=1917967 RepID=UPI003D0A2C32
MKSTHTRRWAHLAHAVVFGAAVASGGVALAQTSSKIMSDSAPLPAEYRSSNGAIVMMDQPVLAQREMMQQNLAATRLQTSVMGNSAAAVKRTITVDELKAMGAAESRGTGKGGAGWMPAR